MRLIQAAIILGMPLVLYWFVIRPRLGAGLTETYSDVDGLWPRVGARLSAFRSFAVFAAGSVIAGLPPLLEALQVLDLSALPQPWPAYVGMATSVLLAMTRAFATTPAGVPPTREA